MYFDVGEMGGLHDSSMFYFIVSYLMHVRIAMNCGLFNMFTLGKSAHQVDSYGSLHAKQTHMEVCMPSRWFIGWPLNPPTKSNTARAGRANLWAAEQGSAASTQTS